ncbi:MAG: SAM-dependent DNA methyltransferase [Phycisphaerales bacterium]|nr:SAM-dependent DNA methyltransferase [Phycisphaerales bacterium]
MRERGGAMAVGAGGSARCLAGAMLILAEVMPASEALGVAVGMLSAELQARAGRGARGVAGGSVDGGGSDPARVRALECIRAGLAEESGVDAFWLGEAYQLALDARPDGGGSRRRRGVFYTPRALVDHLIERTLGDGGGVGSPRVLDPACGCGGFLVAAGRRLAADRARGEVAALLHGIDIDPLAVELCRLALWLEFGDHGDPAGGPERLAAQVRCADALLDPPGEGSFDAVLGNPPFLSQLAASTARGPEQQRRLRKRFGPSVRAYTDPAALFLHLAVDTVVPGGRVGMVLPGSVLAARDASAVRGHVRERAALCSLWVDTGGVFEAIVSTIAVTLRRGAPGGEPVSRFVGRGFAAAPAVEQPGAADGSWGHLAADLLGVPPVRLRGGRTLGELCEITAGFRDEYYAIAAAVGELGPEGVAGGGRPVISVGMIDPACVLWGVTPARIAGRVWARPGVRPGGEVGGARGLLGALLERQGRPKLLVATQTRVIEAAADPTGAMLAITPVITVVPRDPGDLWRVGAVLSSPASSAWVASRCFGTARALGAIKPSAALLRELPVPGEWSGWGEAGESYRLASGAADAGSRRGLLLRAAGESPGASSVRAEAAGELLAWWRDRLPGRPGVGAVRSGQAPA